MVYKNKSWVAIKSKKTLNHEQTHFNIAELFARKIRKAVHLYLKENENYKLEDIANIYHKLEDEYWQTQFLYDREVRKEGKEKANQQKWDKKIDSLLNVYKKYERNITLEDIGID